MFFALKRTDCQIVFVCRYGLPADRLWISVYEDDDETFALWHDEVQHWKICLMHYIFSEVIRSILLQLTSYALMHGRDLVNKCWSATFHLDWTEVYYGHSKIPRELHCFPSEVKWSVSNSQILYFKILKYVYCTVSRNMYTVFKLRWVSRLKQCLSIMA